MKTAISFLIGFLGANLCFAQSNPAGNDAQINLNAVGNSDPITGVIRTFKNNYKGLMGSPYLFNYWLPGVLTLEKGNTIKDLQLKYDAYNDELVYKNSVTKDSSIVKKEFVSSFTLKNHLNDSISNFKKFSFQNDKNQPQTSYFLVYYEGKTALLSLKHKKLIKAGELSGAYKTGNPYDELVDNEEFYLRKNDGTMIKFKPREKTVLEILSDKAPKVKEFIKLSKVNCKNATELSKVIQYYDEN